MNDLSTLSPHVARQLELVRPRFLAALAERLERMEELLELLCEDRRRREPAELLRAEAHRTVGVAATLGYRDLGRLAQEAEARLDAHVAAKPGTPCDDATITAVEELLGEMALVVEAAAA